MFGSPRSTRPGRPGHRPAARRPAFRLVLEALEDRVTPTRFAVIGDFGEAGPSEQHVADLVRSWNPDFVATVGDNNYPTGDASTIDANVGQFYHDFIYPYYGTYGQGSPTGANRFFPTLGNHDWGDAYPNPAGDQPSLDYFTLPGNERYYTLRQGPVELFAIDSDANEPDGITSTSAQAQWLQAQLAASTATWKIVYFHEAPYSSAVNHGSNPTMQWPFQAWGATAVLAGHDHIYERLIKDDNFPYFVNGVGGGGRYNFGAPTAGSQVRWGADFGAMLVDAQADHITFQLIGAWDYAGQVIDSYTLWTQPQAHIPDAPKGLTASAVASGTVKLSWTDMSSNETGFKIEQSLDGIVFTPATTAGPNALSASVTGLLPGLTYTFRVRSTNAAGDSAATNTASATTPSALAPAAPSDLVATTVNAFRIDLSWKDNSTLLPPEDGFKLYRSDDNGSHWVWFASTGTGVTSYSWTGANPSSLYSFRVTAYNIIAESAPTNTAVAPTPPAGAPAAPSNLAATAVTGSRIDLSWTDNSANETGFKLYRSTDNVTWLFFAATGEDVTRYTWWAGSPGSTYSFQVRSYNDAGSSVPSNTVTVTTPAPPAAPSGLAATAVSGTRVDLTWADNSTNEDGFKVYRSTDGTNWTWFASAGANVTSYSWTGASPGTAYSFQVSAYNSVGESAPSNTATATTPAGPAVPTPPSNLVATAVSGGRIDLTWADNSDSETEFRLYRSTDGVNWAWFASAAADATGYTWWGASPGTTYSFRATAYNTAGESAPSNTATATTPAAPAAPSGLAAAAASGTRIDLSWADNSANEDGFKVYRSTDGTNWTWFASAAAAATSYSWTGATPGTAYYFRVSAYNAVGESDPSNTVSVTTPAAPAAPSNLTATAVSASRIDLTWTNNAANADSVRLYYSTDGVNWVWFAEVGPGDTAYTWWGASPGTTYYFRATAHSSADGESDPSNTASATTPS